MRRTPAILAGIFIAITLARVASITAREFDAGILGWLYSVGLGAGVFIASYYTRTTMTGRDGKDDRRAVLVRGSAQVTLIFFVVVDGYFNLVDVLLGISETANVMVKIGGVVYGIFPTVAAALLGWMQGRVDRIPVPPRKYNIGNAVKAWIIKVIEARANKIPEIMPAESKPEIVEPMPKPKKKLTSWVKNTGNDEDSPV